MSYGRMWQPVGFEAQACTNLAAHFFSQCGGGGTPANCTYPWVESGCGADGCGTGYRRSSGRGSACVACSRRPECSGGGGSCPYGTCGTNADCASRDGGSGCLQCNGGCCAPRASGVPCGGSNCKTCDGYGACKPKQGGAVCGECRRCDESGNCHVSPDNEACGPGRVCCNGTCLPSGTPCVAPTCGPNTPCSGQCRVCIGGLCLPSHGNDCLGGTCVDGHCVPTGGSDPGSEPMSGAVAAVAAVAVAGVAILLLR